MPDERANEDRTGADSAQRRTDDPVVLLADDDDRLRGLFGRCLASAGFSVLEAANGHEAVRAAPAHADTIALLVTDVRMPGMSGTELAARLAAVRPELPVIYITGDPASPVEPVTAGRWTVRAKPFQLRELVRAASRLTAATE